MDLPVILHSEESDLFSALELRLEKQAYFQRDPWSCLRLLTRAPAYAAGMSSGRQQRTLTLGQDIWAYRKEKVAWLPWFYAWLGFDSVWKKFGVRNKLHRLLGAYISFLLMHTNQHKWSVLKQHSLFSYISVGQRLGWTWRGSLLRGLWGWNPDVGHAVRCEK